MSITLLQRTCLAFLAAFTLLNTPAHAAPAADRPLLHPLFCDHAVLQRDVKVPVWGWTAPDAKVTVSFAGKSRTATADANGRWMVKLPSMRASAGLRTLTVTSSAGQRTVSIKDVLVGDVWLCSGQSNMEMGIGGCNVPGEIAAANYPQLRLLTVPKLVANQPVDTLQCDWQACTPETVASHGIWGGFSAAAYFFGRDLQRELNIPIGLIHSSWGGTIAEAWTSPEGLRPLGDFDAAIAQVAASARSAAKIDYATQFAQWCQQKDPGTRAGWEKVEAAGDGWKTVMVPRSFEESGLPDFDGMVWLRREFDLPADWAGKALTLELGGVDDFDTTWINGVQVGFNNRANQPRRYTIPASVAKAGRNVIAVRVLDTGGPGGIVGQPERLKITLSGATPAAPVSLAGEWQMRNSASLGVLGSPPPVMDGNNPNVSTVLYNGMIAPLLPYAIKGAIWYQGESNAGRAEQYRRLLPAMIGDWRQRFGVGNFPFYIVQLAAFQPTFAEPRDNDWAELREAQTMTAKNVPNVGLAVAIDIGDAGDIHPKDKLNVGHRLALAALGGTYGKKIEFSGPWYRSMKVSGDQIRLKFDHVDGGLVAKGGKLTGFAIAGADKKFVWADAVIDGKTVVVSSAKVSQPVAVRYAWDVNPVCNLFNQSGLPAVPFRTDTWPGLTAGRK